MYPPRGTFIVTLVSFFGLGFTLHARGNVEYCNPTERGGSMLNNAGDGFGEPMNVILSGLSSTDVLSDNGFVNYARAIGFSTECLGIHLGAPQSANLGDGNGWVNQTYELREDHGNAVLGTCFESVFGGNHLRVNNRVSKEKSATDKHDIVPDGYDIGRDELVAGAVGQTSYEGVSYFTTARNIIGLLAPGSAGINHGISLDGVVTLLTVTLV